MGEFDSAAEDDDVDDGEDSGTDPPGGLTADQKGRSGQGSRDHSIEPEHSA